MNAANQHKKKIRKDLTVLGVWSSWNCAINLDMTIRTSGICVTWSSSWRMKPVNISGIFRSERFTYSRPNYQTIDSQQKKNKRTNQIVDVAVPTELTRKLKEGEKRDKYLDLARKLKKNTEKENNDDTSCNWCALFNHQRIIKGTVRIGNTVKIGHNAENRSWGLRRLAVTQTLVKDHHLMLV